jgi:thiol-disulfide isomerase/thioredoxin
VTTELTAFVRTGCSLCEALLDELEPYRSRYGFGLRVVDVDASEESARRYGPLVPVLAGERGEICHYFLDPDRLRAYLADH